MMVAKLLKGFEPYKWVTQFGFAAVMALMLLRMMDGYVNRIATAVESIGPSTMEVRALEEKQSEWQAVWKAQIELEHKHRAQEAEAIRNELLTSRAENSAIHQKQLEVLQVLCKKIGAKEGGGS